MKATSAEQFARHGSGPLPGLERVRDDAWVLPVPYPDPVVRYTLCSILRDADRHLHVVDPGLDSDDNRGLVEVSLAAIRHEIADVASVTATHLHADHVGMARYLADVSGAVLVMHEAEHRAALAALAPQDPAERSRRLDEWRVPPDRRPELETLPSPSAPDLGAVSEVTDGDVLDVPGWRLTVVHTPGHTGGHIALADAGRSLILTGDHVLPAIFPGLGLGGPTDTNPVADYLRSLERVRAFADHEVIPGHGYRFTGLGERCDELEAHVRTRASEVAAVLDHEPGLSVWELASRLSWTAGWTGLRGFALWSALAQTRMHAELVTGRRRPAS